MEWVVVTNILSFFLPDAPSLREIEIETTDCPDWFTHLMNDKPDLRAYLEDLFEMPPKLETVTFSSMHYQEYKLYTDMKEVRMLKRALPRLCASGHARIGFGREELDIPGLKEQCIETTRALADIGEL